MFKVLFENIGPEEVLCIPTGIQARCQLVSLLTLLALSQEQKKEQLTFGNLNFILL